MNKNDKIAVLTWNIGTHPESKLLAFDSLFIELNTQKPKYFFICLQECNFIQTLNKLINKLKNNNYHYVDTKRKMSLPGTNFSIFILFFIRNQEKNEKYTISCKTDKFPYTCSKNLNKRITKHLQLYDIMLGDKILFHIGNIHSVFGNTQKIINSLIKVNDYIDKRNLQEPIILAGDINSRSIEDNCMRKNVLPCSSSSSNLYCQINGQSVNNLFTLYNLKIKYKNSIPKECVKEINDEIQTQNGGSINYKNLIQNLVNRDFLNYILSKKLLLNGFKEHKIDFPPTYKIYPDKLGESNYRYIQSKGKNGRLTGYPDRIIYKNTNSTNKIKPYLYKTFPMFGNDHLPVLCIFRIK